GGNTSSPLTRPSACMTALRTSRSGSIVSVSRLFTACAPPSAPSRSTASLRVPAFLDLSCWKVHHFMTAIRFLTVSFQLSLHQGRRRRTHSLLKIENEGCVKTFPFERL